MKLTKCKRGGYLGNKGFAVSGILYPILILTLFLIVQILTMMASRKAVLDKNKQQLLDSVNASNKVYTNEELSILITQLQEENRLLQEEYQNDYKTLKDTTYTKSEIDEFMSGTMKEYSRKIDLRGSNYDVNTWYPVVTIVNNGSGGYRRVRCQSSLGNGKPSWATHSSGFSVSVDLLSQVGNWGNRPARTLVLANDFFFSSVSPVGYKNFNQPGTHVFYLRGGGNYYLYTDFIPEWKVYTSKHAFFDDYPDIYVEPVKSYPGITASSEVVIIK